MKIRAAGVAAVLAVGAVLPMVGSGTAMAQPHADTGTLLVAAGVTPPGPLGKQPLEGVGVRITSCESPTVLASLVTGADGIASQDFPGGCYQAEVTDVPEGYGVSGSDLFKVTVTQDQRADVEFTFTKH